MTLDALPKPRRLSTCHRHPAEPVTGVCALCLGERLTYLGSPGDPVPTSSSSITAITVAPELASSAAVDGAKPTSRRTRFPPPGSSSELSRSKSYSAAKCGANLWVSEPRRKSCDVRVRSSLFQLFDLDDGGEGDTRKNTIESKNLGFSNGIPESREEELNADQIRVSGDSIRHNVNPDLQRFEDVEEEEEDVKTMKEYIDLEWQSKRHPERNLKDIAGNIWGAASVFSQKLKKWKMKKRHRGGGGGASQNFDGHRRFSQGEKLNGPTVRETHSEVGEYGCYGRRSCDTEPRFSVDAHRMSLDDPRYSLDEPRASWDGYMVARTIPCLAPIISVTENARIPPTININRSDYGISIEEKMSSIMEDPMTSGGSAQTRDYGSDSSSSQRRNSFDGSSSGMSSNKKTVAVEVDEMKSILNTKVSATGAIYQSVKFVVKDKECRDMDFTKHRLDHSRKDDAIADTSEFKKSAGWRKALNIVGFKRRPRSNQCSEPARHSISEPPEGSRGSRVGNGAFDGKLIRSGSSGSHRMIGSYRRSLSVAESGGGSKKNREELTMERNKSTRYSPSTLENGLLRLYLTPLWNFKSKSGKNRLKNSHSATRSALPAV